jgi:hypothetical protein
MGLSLKESPMKVLTATNLDRKSGILGPKTMGEAPPQPFVPTPVLIRNSNYSMQWPLSLLSSQPELPGSYIFAGSAIAPTFGFLRVKNSSEDFKMT